LYSTVVLHCSYVICFFYFSFNIFSLLFAFV
jgi:hypothetical protein